MSRSARPAQRARWLSLCAEVVAPAVALLVISNGLLYTQPLVAFMRDHRPGVDSPQVRSFVDAQMMALEARKLASPGRDAVIFLGSSSVANGIDRDLLDDLWQAAGVPYLPVKYGLTGFSAYELPMIRRYLFLSDTKYIVYHYNYFVFGDQLHPEAIETRWDTAEALRNLGPDLLFNSAVMPSAGVIGQGLFAYRYKNVLRNALERWAMGTLEARKQDFDYPENEARRKERARVWQTPAPPDDHMRRDILDSERRDDTIGYHGLRRLLELGREHSVPVILAPMPEPNFASFRRYRIDVDEAAIDRKVQRIAAPFGATVLPRSDLIQLERDDTLWRDHIHTHAAGRSSYTRYLAQRIGAIVTGH